MSIFTPLMERQKKYVIPAAWLVLAGLSSIMVIFNQPAHIHGVLDDPNVKQAVQFLPANISDEVFQVYVLMLRYFCLGFCWLAVVVIITHPVDGFSPLITAAALWCIPLAFSLAGDLNGAAYPSPWESILKYTAVIISVLGIACFPLSLHLYPDGKFTPGWMKYLVLLCAGLVGVTILASIIQSSFFDDWGWQAMVLVLLIALSSGAVSQAIRYLREPDPSIRRILLPMLVFSIVLTASIFLSVSGIGFKSALGAMIELHIQSIIPGAFALVILYAIRHDRLWGIQWSTRPAILVPAAAVLLSLLAVWISIPILHQGRLPVQQEVVVSSLPSEPIIPIIFDTDLAQDDYIALLYLLQHPAVELKAITVAGTGEAHCTPGVSNVLSVLDQVQAPAIPVSCGREIPLAGNHEFPAAWRAGVDAFFGIKLVTSHRQPATLPASDLIAGILQDSTKPVTIVAVGPLTNLGDLFQDHPESISKIADIYIMGGAVSTAGNVWLENTKYATAEWNIYIDPHAANLVLQSGVPITLVPLDATNFVPVERSFKRRLANEAATPSARLADQLLATLSPEAGPYYFWDSMAAAISTDRSLGNIWEGPIKVVEEGPEIGRTRLDANGAQIRYARGADRGRFEGLLLGVLNLP
jgi:pyrimidine-specific ribonucleoside hydrolase